MSVLSCARFGCEHIMCNRVILEGSSYICEECYEELKEYKRTWPERMHKSEVYSKIDHFMNNTCPGEFLLLGSAEIDDEFERLTE